MTLPTSSVCPGKHLLPSPEDFHVTPKQPKTTDSESHSYLQHGVWKLWSAPWRSSVPWYRNTSHVWLCRNSPLGSARIRGRWDHLCLLCNQKDFHLLEGSAASTQQKHKHIFKQRFPDQSCISQLAFTSLILPPPARPPHIHIQGKPLCTSPFLEGTNWGKRLAHGRIAHQCWEPLSRLQAEALLSWLVFVPSAET